MTLLDFLNHHSDSGVNNSLRERLESARPLRDYWDYGNSFVQKWWELGLRQCNGNENKLYFTWKCVYSI